MDFDHNSGDDDIEIVFGVKLDGLIPDPHVLSPHSFARMAAECDHFES